MGSGRACFGAVVLCATMVAVMMMAGSVAGQAPAVAPSPADCTVVVFQLTDCLGFVMGQMATPPATCCSNLSSVINTAPQCLCQLYNTSFTGPLGVNVTVAQQLPSKCKLTTPDPSLCTALGIPVAGPVSSSSPGMPPVPMTPIAPSPLGPGMSPMSPQTPVSSAPSGGPGSSPSSAGPGSSPSSGGGASIGSPPGSGASAVAARGVATTASFLLLTLTLFLH